MKPFITIKEIAHLLETHEVSASDVAQFFYNAVKNITLTSMLYLSFGNQN